MPLGVTVLPSAGEHGDVMSTGETQRALLDALHSLSGSTFLKIAEDITTAMKFSEWVPDEQLCWTRILASSRSAARGTGHGARRAEALGVEQHA